MRPASSKREDIVKFTNDFREAYINCLQSGIKLDIVHDVLWAFIMRAMSVYRQWGMLAQKDLQRQMTENNIHTTYQDLADDLIIQASCAER